MVGANIYLNQVVLGDAYETLKGVPAESVSCTVTSPPYDNLRTYTNGYSFNFEGIAQQLYRVTEQGGVVVWVVADATIKGSETGTSFKQALYFKDCGFNLWDTMIYHKANPLPLNKKRYNPAFEYIFLLSKGAPKTFNPIRLPCKHAGKVLRGTFRAADGTRRQKTGNGKPINQTKVATNVFTYNAQSANAFNRQHPATFPEQLAEDQVLTWTNAGDTVLDCFAGSGTTLAVAHKHGRNYIGCEISPEYKSIADTRIAAAKLVNN